MKTMAIRLDEEVHAKLVVLAQLDQVSITDEIRQAIEAHVESKKASADLTAGAEAALAEIDRETASRKKAIESLLGKSDKTEEQETHSGKGARRTRA